MGAKMVDLAHRSLETNACGWRKPRHTLGPEGRGMLGQIRIKGRLVGKDVPTFDPDRYGRVNDSDNVRGNSTLGAHFRNVVGGQPLEILSGKVMGGDNSRNRIRNFGHAGWYQKVR